MNRRQLSCDPSSTIFVPKQGHSATVQPQQPTAAQRLAPAAPSEPKRLLLRAPAPAN